VDNRKRGVSVWHDPDFAVFADSVEGVSHGVVYGAGGSQSKSTDGVVIWHGGNEYDLIPLQCSSQVVGFVSAQLEVSFDFGFHFFQVFEPGHPVVEDLVSVSFGAFGYPDYGAASFYRV
jgi:hypothetical protein